MTVLVGVLCTDGVVIGADSIATSSSGPHRLIQIRSDDKIRIIGDRVIIAGTGSVGLGQRFEAIVQKSWNEKTFQKAPLECVRHLSGATLKDFSETGVQRHPQNGIGFGALLACPFGDKPELTEFGWTDFQPERKTPRMHFVSTGSGQVLADPFLAFASRVLWKEQQPDVKTASFGVYWALDHAIKYAPGGVGEPIAIATLRREKGTWTARLLKEEEMQEQAQHIAEIEQRIGNYPSEIITQAQPTTPPTPPPPSGLDALR